MMPCASLHSKPVKTCVCDKFSVLVLLLETWTTRKRTRTNVWLRPKAAISSSFLCVAYIGIISRDTGDVQATRVFRPVPEE